MEKVVVSTQSVHCNGSDPVTGHPSIYLSLSSTGTVDCPYCGRHFVYQEEISSQ